MHSLGIEPMTLQPVAQLVKHRVSNANIMGSSQGKHLQLKKNAYLECTVIPLDESVCQMHTLKVY